MAIAGPPKAATRPGREGSSPTRTTDGAAANSRDASLYGLSTGTTSSTPGIERSGSSARRDSSPMQPMIVRSTPRERWVRMPRCSMRSRMASSSASVMEARVMMIKGLGARG